MAQSVDNTPEGRANIAAAIANIASSAAGRTKLIDAGVVQVLVFMEQADDNTPLGRANIAKTIKRMNTKPACCVVS